MRLPRFSKHRKKKPRRGENVPSPGQTPSLSGAAAPDAEPAGLSVQSSSQASQPDPITISFVNIGIVRRAIFYILLLWISYLIQNDILSRIRPLGVTAMFIPAVVAAIGMMEGGVWGAAFGLAAGFFGDICFHENTVIFTILFPIFGFLSGFLSEFVLTKKFFSYIFMCVSALLLTAFFQSFSLWMFDGSSFLSVSRTALLQIAWSLPFIIPVYFICRAISMRDFG